MTMSVRTGLSFWPRISHCVPRLLYACEKKFGSEMLRGVLLHSAAATIAS